MTLGQRIRQLRKLSNFSQSEVSEVSGVSVPYLSELENDKSNPSLDVLSKVSESYDISLSDLFLNVGKKPESSEVGGGEALVGFSDFLLTADFSDEMNGDWIKLLHSIHLRGARPRDSRGYIQLYLLLRQILQ